MAVEDIGELVKTKIPGYSDAADIQAALRAYHYGDPNFDPAETDPLELIEPSIAFTINDLQNQIDGITGLSPNLYTAKGSLLSASAPSTPLLLAVGTNGRVLTANSGTATGLEWSTPEVTLTNSATLTNKTLTAPVISTISNTGTVTLPTSTDTLVGRATTDTLTNKTLTAPRINLATNARTASYTLVLSDSSKIIEMSVASGNTLTIPLNATEAFPIGTQIIVLQTNSGQTTLAGTAGVTLNGTPGLKLRAQWSSVTLIKRDTDTWVAIGDLVA